MLKPAERFLSPKYTNKTDVMQRRLYVLIYDLCFGIICGLPIVAGSVHGDDAAMSPAYA